MINTVHLNMFYSLISKIHSVSLSENKSSVCSYIDENMLSESRDQMLKCKLTIAIDISNFSIVCTRKGGT